MAHDDAAARALARVWREARRVVVLTGAGMSTASGVPDFRSPGGRWERYQPVPISFGQQLVAADLERALGAASRCDLFVAAGSSLVVSPVNQMLPLARRGGARAAIVTVSGTPFDAETDVRIAAPVEEVLPAVAQAVLDAEV